MDLNYNECIADVTWSILAMKWSSVLKRLCWNRYPKYRALIYSCRGKCDWISKIANMTLQTVYIILWYQVLTRKDVQKASALTTRLYKLGDNGNSVNVAALCYCETAIDFFSDNVVSWSIHFFMGRLSTF